MPQQTTLRSLAKAYANAQMEQEEYRRQRTAYLEGVLAGDIRLPVNPPVPLPGAAAREGGAHKQAGDPGPAVAELREGVSAGRVRGNPGKIMLAGGIVVLLIAAGVFLMSGGDESSPAQSVTAPGGLVEAPPSAGQDLISSFLVDNLWSQSSMNSFLASWQSLPDAERSATRDTIEFSQLGNAIYKKLLEERALSRIGNPETAYEKQRQFVQFAASLGIDDPRISLPERGGMESLN